MTLTTTPNTLQTKQKQKQTRQLVKRKEGQNGQRSLGIKKCSHILAFNMIPILLCLCWLPDFIVALKDVSVTIPQAVKRGSNAMLTCNYDMENDTLYSVKWYKGRREFYRYTPKENPAMKVFPSQSGLNVERNLSNQSHVVLLAVPLNISGKFTCEISVEAPSFQTAMVSGDMEVVELPEEQATVTGIQPRYRIGDLVDGNCSIKYSKPAANLTWTINGIVVPPHHIKTYQIEKYAETNLESVMSAVHFMVTNQHFIKGQMRLKCTASIFDIFKEEIENIIEEDRPRIMASGQSHPPDHGYGTHGDTDGYEHNESYLTYFSAPKSSAASPAAEFVVDKMIKRLKQKLSNYYQLFITFKEIITRKYVFAITLGNNKKNIRMANNFNKISLLQVILMRFIVAILFLVLFSRLIKQNIFRNEKTQDKQMAGYNLIAENLKQKHKQKQEQYNFSLTSLWHKTLWKRNENEQQTTNENCYQDKNANDDVCQTKYGQQQQHQYEKKHYLVLNQNVVNATEKILSNATNINRINTNTNKKTIVNLTTAIDCQYHMSQTYAAFATLSPTAFCCPPIHLPVSSSLSSTTTTSKSSSSSSFSRALGYRKKCAHDSFPLYNVDAYKSNNAKYMSKDQTLLMTFTVTAAKSIADVFAVAVAVAPLATLAISNPLYKAQSAFAHPKAISLRTSLALKLLSTSVYTSLPIVEINSLPYYTTIFYRNNYLMAFIGELLLHQC